MGGIDVSRTGTKSYSLLIAVTWMLIPSAGMGQSQGAAQTQAQSQAGAVQPCEAALSRIGESSQNYLFVSCGSGGAVLGIVDNYISTFLPALKATVIVTSAEGAKRAWLVFAGVDDTVVVEEITNTLAVSVGRGPNGSIDGLDLELANGAKGRLTARLKAGAGQSQGDAAGDIDLAKMVGRARATRVKSAGNDGK